MRAFDIPAINNEFEVLAQQLGIADDNDQERSQIEVLGEQDGISSFKYRDEKYLVARMGRLPGAATAVEFNSGWYAVQKGEGASLYQAARDALNKLIQESGVKAGRMYLVFDIAMLGVAHASFARGPAPRIKPSEYLVTVNVSESKSEELSVMAAAINAVNELNRRIALAPSERGLPDMKGLMFSCDGAAVAMAPYDEKILGFAQRGETIINPMLSPNRAYEVDPIKAYGFKELDDGQAGRILVRPHEDGGHLRLSLANNGFIIDRYDAGNQKIAYVFSSKLPDSELGAWMSRMPEGFLVHREEWRRAFERLIELEPESHRPDQDEKGFWRHELRALDFAYGELDSLRGVQLQPDSDWSERLPHDFLSHRGSWRSAFERLIELEPDADEKGRWEQHLEYLDAGYGQLDEVLAVYQPELPSPGCP